MLDIPGELNCSAGKNASVERLLLGFKGSLFSVDSSIELLGVSMFSSTGSCCLLARFSLEPGPACAIFILTLKSEETFSNIFEPEDLSPRLLCLVADRAGSSCWNVC
ncbi:hypothetical protein O6H91_01G116000 [Diphasiastrum complanatum]|uniref:Uncharacterized protein n=1 Tax=Diphasiastrum complanatum TaxID=34168 RepID=A0ACC2EV01_DIPCM|nr:hypothetical protein O6H91_01G116000 [Diphasiastrum complanatum]